MICRNYAEVLTQARRHAEGLGHYVEARRPTGEVVRSDDFVGFWCPQCGEVWDTTFADVLADPDVRMHTAAGREVLATFHGLLGPDGIPAKRYARRKTRYHRNPID